MFPTTHKISLLLFLKKEVLPCLAFLLVSGPQSFANPVIGMITGSVFQGSESFVAGWACQSGEHSPVSVKIFRGARPGNADAVEVGSALANEPVADPKVAQKCGTASAGFLIKIPEGLRQAYAGQRLYAQAATGPIEGESRIHARKVFFVENRGGADATAAIDSAIREAGEAAATSGAGEVLLGKGVYNATSCAAIAHARRTCFELKNPSAGKLILGGDEGGTELLMHDITLGAFQSAQHSNNIVLADLTIDYPMPGFTQGTITAVTPGPAEGPVPDRETLVDVKFDTDPQFPSLDAMCVIPRPRQKDSFHANNQWGFIAERTERGLKHNTPSFWFPFGCEKMSGAGTNFYRLHMHRFFVQYARAGDRYVQVVTRKNPVLLFADTRNITLDNVVVRAGGGAATTWVRDSGTITLDRFQVAFGAGTDRLMTTTADGFIALNNWARIVISNSRFEGMGDDAINIHAIGCFAGAPPSDDGGFPITEMGGGDCGRFFHVGDTVQIVSPLDARIKGQAHVASLRPGPDRRTMMALDNAVPGLRSGVFVGQPGEAANPADILYNVSAGSPGSLIAHSFFGRFRGAGVVDRSPGSTIRFNVFSNLNGPAMVFGQRIASAEGPLPSHIRVEANGVTGGDVTGGPADHGAMQIDLRAGNLAGPAAGGVSDVVFAKNRFFGSCGSVFTLTGAKDIAIDDTAVELASLPCGAADQPLFKVSDSQDVKIQSLLICGRRGGVVPEIVAGQQGVVPKAVSVREGAPCG